MADTVRPEVVSALVGLSGEIREWVTSRVYELEDRWHPTPAEHEAARGLLGWEVDELLARDGRGGDG